MRLGIIRSIVNSGAIPILTCLGLAPGGQLVNVNADSATRALVAALKPVKIIFLTGIGGLLDQDGDVIHSINLAAEYDGLMEKDWVADGMRLKLAEIKKLLDEAPLSSSVSITTPSGLVRELFTHGGSGTLIRKGELINAFSNKADVDGARSASLVEKAFGRPLLKHWWQKLDLSSAYISESYRAGAYLTKNEDYVYLDKFAVLEDARGEGLARTVWRRFLADHPSFFWRSRTENGFNAFYHNEADGSVKDGDWTIFWKGEQDFARIAKVVKDVASLPPGFEGD